VTPEEYEERSRPILDVIADLRLRHEKELKPWYERLYALNAVYMPPLMVPVEVWERLQLEQGIRSGSVSSDKVDV